MSDPGQIVGDIYPATFTATVIDPPGSGIWRNVTGASGCYYAPTSFTYNFPAFALGIDNAPGCNTTLYSSAAYNVIIVNKSPTSSLGLTTQSCTDLYMGIYNFTANGGKYENAGAAVRSLDYGPVGQFNSNIRCAAAASLSSNANAQAPSSGAAASTGTIPVINSSSTSALTNSTSSATRGASSSVATAAVVTRATSTTSGTRSVTSPAAATATTNAADSVAGSTGKWQLAVALLAGSLAMGL